MHSSGSMQCACGAWSPLTLMHITKGLCTVNDTTKRPCIFLTDFTPLCSLREGSDASRPQTCLDTAWCLYLQNEMDQQFLLFKTSLYMYLQCKHKVLIETWYTYNRTHLFTTAIQTVSGQRTKIHRNTRVFGHGEEMPLLPTFDKKGAIKGTACTLKVGMVIVTTASTAPDSEAVFLNFRHVSLLVKSAGPYSCNISDRRRKLLKATNVVCQRMKSSTAVISLNMALKAGL